MEIDKRGHQKNRFPLLVVESNKDHQLIIGYCLKAKIPQADPMFTTTAKEAVSFLQLSFSSRETFPKLVLLEPLLPSLAEGFGLLTEIRTLYPFLPVVILSSQQEQSLIYESYQHGAHSFVVKPASLDEWESKFQTLKEYWLGVVSLVGEL